MSGVDISAVRAIAEHVVSTATLRKYEEEEADWLEFICDNYFWGEPPRFDRISAEYAWVIDEFERFTRPTPADAQALKDVLAKARGRLEADVAGHMNPVDLEITDWSGDAFETFEENYIAQFPEKKVAHIELIRCLESMVDGHQAVMQETWESVYRVGEETQKALNKYDPFSGADTLAAAEVTLTVIGAIVGAATTISTGGAMAPVVITMLTAGAMAAKHNTVEGSDVDSFLADMKVRLADIETNGVVPEEEEIIGVMDKNMTEIESKYSSLVPPYPSLADVDPESPEDDEILPPGWKTNG